MRYQPVIDRPTRRLWACKGCITSGQAAQAVDPWDAFNRWREAGECFDRAGNQREAKRCYHEAGQANERYWKSLPPNRVKTRSVHIAQTAMFFLYAEDYEQVRRIGGLFIGAGWLDGRAKEQLIAALEEIPDDF